MLRSLRCCSLLCAAMPEIVSLPNANRRASVPRRGGLVSMARLAVLIGFLATAGLAFSFSPDSAPAKAAPTTPQPAAVVKGTSPGKPPACFGDKIRLGVLSDGDADALAQTLNSVFDDFIVTAEAPEESKPRNTLCVLDRHTGGKPKRCNARTGSPETRCVFNEVGKRLDRDNFKGVSLNSNYVIYLLSILANQMAQALPHPTPDLNLEAASAHYLIAIPSAAVVGQSSVTSGSLAKQAAGLKSDLGLLDKQVAMKNGEPDTYVNSLAGRIAVTDPGNSQFLPLEAELEQWLAHHTVTLSVLDPRDVVLELEGLFPGRKIQTREKDHSITILPVLSEAGHNSAFLAADAIERNARYVHQQTEKRWASQGNDGSSSTNQGQRGGGGGNPGSGGTPASRTQGGGSDPSSGSTSWPQQEPLPMDRVQRLYHLRQAKDIATAINKASGDGRDLVEPLNDDLLLILPPTLPAEHDAAPDIHRAIAVLDLPRPQLSLQVWSYQVSSEERDDPKRAESAQWAFSQVGQRVADANGKMTSALQRGFGAVVDRVFFASPEKFFDTVFYNYLTQRYQDCVNEDHYCLAYYRALATPFSRPGGRVVDASLTRLLLFLIAAGDEHQPEDARAFTAAVRAMNDSGCPDDLTKVGDDALLCFPTFYTQLRVASNPRNLHILRAALLDFMFQHKQIIAYPNDFVPYDLQRTAHVLDSLLSPIDDAFNQDIDSFIRHRLEAPLCEKGASPCVKAKGFVSTSMVQVAAISGTQATVSGKVNNYFDITPPISLNDIFNPNSQNLSQNIATALKDVLTPKEITIVGALANIASRPEITAEIARDATLTITPTALDTASSAELNVDFEIKDDSPPQSANQSTPQHDLLDRVADHHVTSRVRVDSLKLFDISAFTMELSHPQPPFPIYPLNLAWKMVFGPFPKVNKLFEIPRAPKKVDNRSIAIVRAVVVPTAMDFGESLGFEGDRVWDPVTDTTAPMSSMQQIGGKIRPFHKLLMQCIVKEEDDRRCLGLVKLSSTHEDLR